MAILRKFGALPFVISFATVVIADRRMLSLTLTSTNSSGRSLEYYEGLEMANELNDEGTNMALSIIVKKTIPSTLMIKATVTLNGRQPVVYVTTLCDGIERYIENNLAASGEILPKRCPLEPGRWSIPRTPIRTDKFSPDIPEGPIAVVISVYEEGKEQSPLHGFGASGTLSYINVP